MTTPKGLEEFMAALNRTVGALDDPTVGLSNSLSFMEHLGNVLQVTKMGASDSEQQAAQRMYDSLLDLYRVTDRPPRNDLH